MSYITYSATAVYKSTDGINWTSEALESPIGLENPTFIKKFLNTYYVGSTSIFKSTSYNGPFTEVTSNAYSYSTAQSTTQFAYVSSVGEIPSVEVTSDNENWDSYICFMPNLSYAGGYWWNFQQNTNIIYRTSNLSTGWTTINLPYNGNWSYNPGIIYLESVNKYFLYSLVPGLSLWSDDGITWRAFNANIPSPARTIYKWLNKAIIIATETSFIYYSEDGINFKQAAFYQDNPSNIANYIYGLYGNNENIAIIAESGQTSQRLTGDFGNNLLYLNANLTNSYSGTGTSFVDISGQNNNFTVDPTTFVNGSINNYFELRNSQKSIVKSAGSIGPHSRATVLFFAQPSNLNTPRRTLVSNSDGTSLQIMSENNSYLLGNYLNNTLNESNFSISNIWGYNIYTSNTPITIFSFLLGDSNQSQQWSGNWSTNSASSNSTSGDYTNGWNTIGNNPTDLTQGFGKIVAVKYFNYWLSDSQIKNEYIEFLNAGTGSTIGNYDLVALGKNSTNVVFTKDITPTLYTTGMPVSAEWNNMANGNNVTVATANGNNNIYWTASSPNASGSWTPYSTGITIGATQDMPVVCLNGEFFVYVQPPSGLVTVFRSVDGKVWTNQISNLPPNSLISVGLTGSVINNRIFITTFSSTFYYSDDGVNFFQVTAPNTIYYKPCWDGTSYYLPAGVNGIYKTVDFSTYETINLPVSNSIVSCAYSEISNKLVALTSDSVNGGIWYSNDKGLNWIEATSQAVGSAPQWLIYSPISGRFYATTANGIYVSGVEDPSGFLEITTTSCVAMAENTRQIRTTTTTTTTPLP